jgi:hypothetical protein
MPVFNGGNFLLSGTANGSGTRGPTFDNRASESFGYLYYSAAGASALLSVQVAHDATAWMPFLTLTATTGTIGATAVVSAFYPYYTVQINALFSGAAGTASPVVHFTPGAI